MNPEQRANIRKLIEKAQEDGRFLQLSPRQRFVLDQRHLQPTKVTLEDIGKKFQPPVTGGRVGQIETKAIQKLRFTSKYSIEALGLPVRVTRALIRHGFGNLAFEELLQIPDEDLLSIRNFGGKSLHLFREKLAANLP